MTLPHPLMSLGRCRSVLPATIVSVSVAVPGCTDHRRRHSAELPETVQPVSVASAAVVKRPPPTVGRVAGDGAVGERHHVVRVEAAALFGELPETVQPVSVIPPPAS